MPKYIDLLHTFRQQYGRIGWRVNIEHDIDEAHIVRDVTQKILDEWEEIMTESLNDPLPCVNDPRAPIPVGYKLFYICNDNHEELVARIWAKNGRDAYTEFEKIDDDIDGLISVIPADELQRTDVPFLIARGEPEDRPAVEPPNSLGEPIPTKPELYYWIVPTSRTGSLGDDVNASIAQFGDKSILVGTRSALEYVHKEYFTYMQEGEQCQSLPFTPLPLADMTSNYFFANLIQSAKE